MKKMKKRRRTRCGDCRRYAECDEEILRVTGEHLDPDETFFEIEGCEGFKSKDDFWIDDRKL